MEVDLDLLSSIDALNRSRETSQLFKILADSMEKIGFDRLNFYCLSCNEHNELFGKFRWAHNYPDDYTGENIDKLLLAGDPIISLSYTSDGLCKWSDMTDHVKMSSSEKQLLASRESSGLHGGASIPLRAVFGILASLEIASSLPGTVYSERSLSVASIVAVHFFKCFSSIQYQSKDTKPVRLTTKEREVLLLLSRGCTKSEVAAELGVTSYAVDFHCRNIMKKFSTNKMIVAVVNALQCGLLPSV